MIYIVADWQVGHLVSSLLPFVLDLSLVHAPHSRSVSSLPSLLPLSYHTIVNLFLLFLLLLLLLPLIFILLLDLVDTLLHSNFFCLTALSLLRLSLLLLMTVTSVCVCVSMPDCGSSVIANSLVNRLCTLLKNESFYTFFTAVLLKYL